MTANNSAAVFGAAAVRDPFTSRAPYDTTQATGDVTGQVFTPSGATSSAFYIVFL